MPRSRGSEMPSKQSPRCLHPLRTSSSDSDPLHHRSTADRNPKVGDRRSPRGPQPDSLNRKKLGTRIADLESQLGQAQEELKFLKEQLASAEAAKKEAQIELEKKTKKPAVPETKDIQQNHPRTEIQCSKIGDKNTAAEIFDDSQLETDVFEIPVENKTVEPRGELASPIDQLEKESNQIDMSTEPSEILEPEKPSLPDLALEKDEANILKTKLEEKEKELEVFGKDNENLKNQLKEAASNFSFAKVKEEKMSTRLGQLSEELEASKANAAQLKEKLEVVEVAKEALETEMKLMRVQTEQWKKAADAAAAVLAGGVEMNGRISETCGYMDKHLGGVFETPASGYSGFVGSPGMADDMDDGFGSTKRKGSGIKMFGDFWKKKGQK